jgi:hypothetical protein
MIQPPPPPNINDPPPANRSAVSPVTTLLQQKSLFLPILAANGLIYLPVILASRPLLDDMGRSVGGYASWAKTGRPLAELLIALTNLGYPATAAQISSQLIAVVFLALSGLVVASLFNIRSKALAALCAAPLTAHPYFLENMSYIFDAPSMAAALFCSVLAVFIPATSLRDTPLPNPTWRSGIPATLLMFCSLLLYQPAVNVVFVMGTFAVACALFRSRPKRAVRLALLFASAGITAVGSYWALFGRWASLEMHYPSPRTAAIHVLLNYWSRVWADWSSNGILFVFLSVIIAGLFIVFWRAARSNSSAALTSTAALMVVLAVFLQHGLLIFISYEWPFPRTYVSFGTILALVALTVASMSEKFKNKQFYLLINMPSMATYYVLFVIASSTGSAMTAQRWFEFGLVMQIAQDVTTMNGGRSPQDVRFVGTAPVSPVMTNTIRKFPVIKRIVVNAMSNDWIWGHILVQYYTGLWWPQDSRPMDSTITDNKQPSLVRPWYTIFVFGDRIVVQFRP